MDGTQHSQNPWGQTASGEWSGGCFRDKAPWWGGDLQTLRNLVQVRRVPLPSRSLTLEFPVSDGSSDRLVSRLELPAETKRKCPLIVLIHGLTGSEDSAYMRETTRFHLLRGRSVLRLNLRGAGPGRHRASNYYHGGCWQDIRDVLDQLDRGYLERGVFLIGFSLGGNILLNFLAGARPGQGILGAATVSAPIEPLEACRRLLSSRNWLYHHWLLRRMKRTVLSCAELSKKERSDIEAARSMYEFDDKWVAPRNGFPGAGNYYRRTTGARCVPSINVPLLMLHAENDPLVPARSYARLAERQLPYARVVIAQSGGHVGFHQRGYLETWHDRAIDLFLNEINVS
ncbi:MAG: alpha/beta fold hydrolase [Pseudomonadota bacterium]